MQEILKKISELSQYDLQQVMQAIEKRYARDYPDWDVYYVALHKDPELRRQQIANITQFVHTPKEPEEQNFIYFPKE